LKGVSLLDSLLAAVLEWRGWRWAAFCILAAGFTDFSLHAGVIEAWVQRYSMVVSNSNDSAAKVLVDAAGDVIVAGYTEDGTGSDMLTIKYSGADGAEIWRARYDGPTHQNDEARAMAIDNSGDVIVTGFSSSEFYTVKYAAADGAVLWEKRGPRGAAAAIAIDGNNDVVVTGSSLGAGSDYYTAKYAGADGAVLWEQSYNGLGNDDDSATAVALDSSGNVVVTGLSRGTEGATEFYTAKYEATSGMLLWEKRGPPGGAEVVMVDGNDDVVVAGTSTFDYYTVKYAAADGAVLWEQLYNGPGNGEEHLRAMTLDASGNVIVTGSSMGEESAQDSYTAKYAAASGILLWERRYNSPANMFDEAQAVAVDSAGNVVVTGFSVTETNSQRYTAKYASDDGALLWQQAGRAGYGQAVMVDSGGDVLVAGLSPGSAGFFDAYTAKYGSSDGALRWEQNYNGPANRTDAAQAVAMDARGNVIVTGASVGGGGTSDYYTSKYAAKDGSLLWEVRYDGPAKGPDMARALALDGAGNVVVTGESWNGTDSDFYTAKYAAPDGAVLWERRYSGPENASDSASAVAIDNEGNVAVTGSSGSDYFTAKYSGTDGTILWEQRVTHIGDINDSPAAIAVDSSGNVVVTGRSGGGGSGADFYTAKYGATTGTLMWERRYNGPANSIDEAIAVAVDANNDIVVTGSSYDGPAVDFYTAKYGGSDGAVLWEKRHTGFGFARAMVLDKEGNAVVTGSSFDSSDSEYYTVKYAAGDGAVLWEKGGPEGNARALAVDGSGNVIMTGFSMGTDSRNDYYTAKYAANDGALIWERRYNGPANRDDMVNTSGGLAVGPDGVIAVTGSSAVYTRTYDYATVVYWEHLPPIRIALAPEGVRLGFSGIPGRTYDVQRANALDGSWTTIGSVTAPDDNDVTGYIDNDPVAGAAFYRVSTE